VADENMVTDAVIEKLECDGDGRVVAVHLALFTAKATRLKVVPIEE